VEERIEIVRKILSNFIEDFYEKKIENNANLMNYGLDSLGFIKTIIEIEDKFDIIIPDEYITLFSLNTVEKIISVINEIIENKNKGILKYE